MKKSHILLAVVPIICALGGFGVGQLMKSDAVAAPAHSGDALPKPQSPAEAVLHSMADEEQHAPEHAEPEHDKRSALTMIERILPASIKVAAEDHAKAPTKLHRVPQDMLREHEEQMAQKAKLEKARAEMERREALAPRPQLPVRTAHPSLLPMEMEEKFAEGAIKLIENTDDHLVKLGRLTIPVQKAASVTYLVADFGVSVTDLDQASHYYNAENAARLRDQIITTMNTVAETQLLRGAEIDSEKVAERVSQDLRTNFFGVEDFIFLSLYKTDIPRG